MCSDVNLNLQLVYTNFSLTSLLFSYTSCFTFFSSAECYYNYPFVFLLHFLSSPSSSAPKAAFLLDNLNPVLESLTPLLGFSSPYPVSHLTPYFTAELRLISPQSSEQRSLYCWSTLNYPQLKPNANKKIALLWNDFKRTRVSRIDWRKSWVVASGGREEILCCVFPSSCLSGSQ